MATNNNLIPINIRDLPKLDILSNSDLIPIETVEGTATILYRDFIIDEAHVTFAATLSASVASAITLSAAIDATNATVATVSSSLYSSIINLSNSFSSSITALSSSLISSLTSLSSQTTYISAVVTVLSASNRVNQNNIVALTNSFNTLKIAVSTLSSSSANIFIPTTPNQRGPTLDPIFTPPVGMFVLEANKAYRLTYNILYSKEDQVGTATFVMSSSFIMDTVGGRMIHSRASGSETSFGLLSGSLIYDNNVNIKSFPPTGNLPIGNVYQFADIDVVIQTDNAPMSATLAVSCDVGKITPHMGSSCNITKLN
jgi:hypothetical protein